MIDVTLLVAPSTAARSRDAATSAPGRIRPDRSHLKRIDGHREQRVGESNHACAILVGVPVGLALSLRLFAMLWVATMQSRLTDCIGLGGRGDMDHLARRVGFSSWWFPCADREPYRWSLRPKFR